MGDIARLRRYADGTVSVTYDSKTPLQPGSNAIGAIPAGYRPAHDIYVPLSTGGTYDARLSVCTERLSIYNYSSEALGNTVGYVEYITGDPAPQTA